MTPITSPRTRSQDPDASPKELDDPALGVPESQWRPSTSSPGARTDAPGTQTLGEADAPDAMPVVSDASLSDGRRSRPNVHEDPMLGPCTRSRSRVSQLLKRPSQPRTRSLARAMVNISPFGVDLADPTPWLTMIQDIEDPEQVFSETI